MRSTSQLGVVLLAGLGIGLLLAGSRTNVAAQRDADAYEKSANKPIDDVLSHHHLHLEFDMPPGRSKTLDLPVKSTPVHIQIAITNVVECGFPTPHPILMEAVAAQDAITGKFEVLDVPRAQGDCGFQAEMGLVFPRTEITISSVGSLTSEHYSVLMWY